VVDLLEGFSHAGSWPEDDREFFITYLSESRSIPTPRTSR
jgi:hypothetical protein